MTTKYGDFFILHIADKSKPPIGCGYYYIVTHGAYSHTAFRTKRALKVWLKQTGLKIGKRTYNRCVYLTGNYIRDNEMIDTKEFFNKYGHLEPFYALDNGDYSIGFIEHSPEGNTLHIQNPNTDRPILDYFKVSEHLETGKDMRFIYRSFN
jgi:hypothetical protein